MHRKGKTGNTNDNKQKTEKTKIPKKTEKKPSKKKRHKPPQSALENLRATVRPWGTKGRGQSIQADCNLNRHKHAKLFAKRTSPTI